MIDEGKNLEKKIFSVSNENFEKLAIEIFNYQYLYNEVYHQYCSILKINAAEITTIEQIPFLPIQFFKSKQIKTTQFNQQIIFESSGTTGSINSKHYVKDCAVYEQSFLNTFRHFYGQETKYCILGLLPSYLERKGSSLVYMVDKLIHNSEHKNSGFYLYNHGDLKEILLQNEAAKQPTLLIGVTYALIDFAEQNRLNLIHTIVMETGGMKGRKEELTRKEVHHILASNLGLQNIHSEYGMTELLSQAYSSEKGIFKCPAWMKTVLRAQDNPLEIFTANTERISSKIGGINCIDLANLYSCSFIATDDVGTLYEDDCFKILGRQENSDIRGCGLMVL